MSHVCRDIVASGICFKRLDIYFQQFRTCNINSWSRHQTRRELEHQSRSLHCHADSLSLAILSRLPFHIESHMKRSDGCDKVGGESMAGGEWVGCWMPHLARNVISGGCIISSHELMRGVYEYRASTADPDRRYTLSSFIRTSQIGETEESTCLRSLLLRTR